VAYDGTNARCRMKTLRVPMGLQFLLVPR
jgi:hypothetical protein